MELSPDSSKIICLNDSGNKSRIYEFEPGGNITKNLDPSGADNEDWEDMAQDDLYYYIGDFGNNSYDRDEFVIYKVLKSDIKPNDDNQDVETLKLEFELPHLPQDEDAFPDIESMFVLGGHLYLFSRNRDNDFDGISYIYRLNKNEDNQMAEKIGEIFICDKRNACQVTSADISPSGQKIALLTSDKVILLTEFTTSRSVKSGQEKFAFAKAKKTMIRLNHFSQKESIVFITDDELIISDERKGTTGGNLYRLQIE